MYEGSKILPLTSDNESTCSSFDNQSNGGGQNGGANEDAAAASRARKRRKQTHVPEANKDER